MPPASVCKAVVECAAHLALYRVGTGHREVENIGYFGKKSNWFKMLNPKI